MHQIGIYIGKELVLLQDLIKYGGRSEVEKVIIELKARIPRHPVYIAVFCVL